MGDIRVIVTRGLRVTDSREHVGDWISDHDDLPTGLLDAGQLPEQRVLPEADATERKLADVSARPSAEAAAIAAPG